MKVSDLIAVLQTLPQDEEIAITGQYDDMEGYCQYGDSVCISYERFIVSTITKRDGRTYESEVHEYSNYANAGKNPREVIKLVLSETYGEPIINLDKPTAK